MEQNKEQKIFKFAKIYSVILIIFGILCCLVVIWGLIIYISNPTSLLAAGVTMQELRGDSLNLGFVAIYCLIGGIGLYKLRKWAMYFVAAIGIWVFFWGLFEFITFSGFGYAAGLGIGKLINGIFSMYLIRNRHYFDKR